MNNEQKDWIKNLLNKFDYQETLKAIAKHYQDTTDFNLVEVGRHKVSEIGAKTKQVIEQFKQEFKTNDNLDYLPFNINTQEFGNGTLKDDIEKLIRFNNINESEQALCRIIYYQITHGFWDKQNKELKKQEQSKLDQFKGELEQIASYIECRSEKTESLIQSLNDEKVELSKFIAQKTNELQEIQNSLQTVRNHTTSTTDLLTHSTSTSEKINSILELQQKNLKSLEESIKTHSEAVEHQNTAFAEKVAVANSSLEDTKRQAEHYHKVLTIIKEKTQYFDERNSFLDELIGREVGASLFETFKQRKNELNSAVNFWRWAVLGLAVLTILWVIVLFWACPISGQFSERLEILFINTLKTSPVIILLIFAMNQYKKERNFQEDYAFKSAVALTIDAYANRLSETNRDKLIMESVQGVYKSPHLEQEKSPDLSSKGLFGIIKELTSLIEKIKK